MKAMVVRRYGVPDEVLELREMPTPTPGPQEVLLRVEAASLNSWDADLVRGHYMLVRLVSGVLRPRQEILGADVAGVVQAVGSDVRDFRVGDQVYGDLSAGHWGGFAEYACARESELRPKPRVLSFAQAAAVPQAAVMALQGVRDYGRVRTGEHVLINGAGGGVGTFAVQLAKQRGAWVTAVDAASKLETLRQLGADHVIDYRSQDFVSSGQRYDVILDTVCTRPMGELARSLRPEGRYVMVGGETKYLLQLALFGRVLSRRHGVEMRLLTHQANHALSELSSLLDVGALRVVIDAVEPLTRLPRAVSRLAAGEVIGKVVVEPGAAPSSPVSTSV